MSLKIKIRGTHTFYADDQFTRPMPSLHTENKLVPVVRNILLPSVHKVFM